MSQVRILLGAPVSLQKVGARGFEPPTSCAQGRRATRLRYAPLKAQGKYTLSGRGSSFSHGAVAREPLQDRPQPRERTPAMRQAILLCRVQLRQRLSRRFRGQEDRIVPEPVRSPFLERDSSVHLSFRAQDPLAFGRAERDRAEEVRRALLLGNFAQRPEEPGAALLVGRGVSRAVHSRRAAEGVHAEAAVVGERPEPALPRADGGLLRRVVVEGRAGFVGRGQPHVPEREQLERDAGEDLADLGELPGVRGRNQQLHFANAPAIAASCFWCNSARPFCASATISASWPGVNGLFSAVPCTSRSSPAALPTTFMSTSAEKSSS